MGSSSPVYSRADLSRTVAVVALFLTAISTSAAARQFRAADTPNEDYPAVQALRYMDRLIAAKSGGRLQIRVFHSRQARRGKGHRADPRRQANAAGVKIVTDIDRKPFEAAMAGIYAEVQRDPAAGALHERTRKVE